jgi:hypothetical protein
VKDEVEAAIRVLASMLPAEVTEERIDLALVLLGDALRLEVDGPSVVRAWVEAVPDAELHRALSRVIDPFGNELPTIVDEFLEASVQHRDRAESVMVAVRRVRSEWYATCMSVATVWRSCASTCALV